LPKYPRESAKSYSHSRLWFACPHSNTLICISWLPPETQRDLARKLLVFLEDRRALYNSYDFEMPEYVDRSIIEIRHKLTEILETIDEHSELSQHVRAMRAACRSS